LRGQPGDALLGVVQEDERPGFLECPGHPQARLQSPLLEVGHGDQVGRCITVTQPDRMGSGLYLRQAPRDRLLLGELHGVAEQRRVVHERQEPLGHPEDQRHGREGCRDTTGHACPITTGLPEARDGVQQQRHPRRCARVGNREASEGLAIQPQVVGRGRDHIGSARDAHPEGLELQGVVEVQPAPVPTEALDDHELRLDDSPRIADVLSVGQPGVLGVKLLG